MNPVLIAGLAFAMGCAVGLEHLLPWWGWGALLIAVLTGFVIAWRRETAREILIGLVCGLCILAGGLTASLHESAAEKMKSMQGQETVLTGSIVPGSFHRRDFGGASFLLAEKRGNVRIQVKKWQGPDLKTDKVQIRGRFSSPDGFYNPFQVSPLQNAAVQNLGGRLSAQEGVVHILPAKPTLATQIFMLGETLRKQVKQAMSPKDSGLLLGMLLGESAWVEGETLRLFQRLGLSHLLSVSGSHVSLLMGLIAVLFSYLSLPRKITGCGIFLLLVCYGILCGGKASICRAGILGSGVLWGNLHRKKADSSAFLGAALLILLAWHPFWVWDIGFQLSFSAALGLITLQKPVQERLHFLPPFFAAGLSVPISAQLLSLPFLVQHFHSLSFVSLPANLFLVPLLSLVLSLTAVGSVLGAVGAKIVARFFLSIAAQSTGFCLWLGEFLCKLPGSHWITGAVLPWIWPLYGLLLVALFNKSQFGYWGKWLRGGTVFLSGIGILFILLLPQFQNKNFTVYFLDVGQGDCALVCTPDGGHILMDTGGLSGGYDVGERIIVPVLRGLGVEKVDAVFLSHGHHDHTGGLAGLLRWIPVESLYLPRETLTPNLEYIIKQGINMKNVKFVYKIQTNQKVFLKGSIICTVEAPEEPAKGGSNETSAIVRVTADGRSILFTGDAPAEIEHLAATKQIRSDVLKVSHHGSKTSSDWEFLQAVAPQLAVISVGRENRFGHPHQETINKLSALSIPVARTDQSGAIRVQLDAEGIYWSGSRQDVFSKEQRYE